MPFAFLRYWPAYVSWTLLSLIMLAMATALMRQLPEIVGCTDSAGARELYLLPRGHGHN